MKLIRIGAREGQEPPCVIDNGGEARHSAVCIALFYPGWKAAP